MRNPGLGGNKAPPAHTPARPRSLRPGHLLSGLLAGPHIHSLVLPAQPWPPLPLGPAAHLPVYLPLWYVGKG